MPLEKVSMMRRKYNKLVELVNMAKRNGNGEKALEVFLAYLDGDISREEALKKLKELVEA